MILYSLCGCLKRDCKTTLAIFAFSDSCGLHYRKFTKCAKKADQDPMWQQRRELPKDYWSKEASYGPATDGQTTLGGDPAN